VEGTEYSEGGEKVTVSILYAKVEQTLYEYHSNGYKQGKCPVLQGKGLRLGVVNFQVSDWISRSLVENEEGKGRNAENDTYDSVVDVDVGLSEQM